jgi:hypothetical protein
MNKDKEKYIENFHRDWIRGDFCPTLRGDVDRSAEETLQIFHSSIFQRKNIAIDEFLPMKYQKQQAEVHKIIDAHWTHCFNDLEILHKAVDPQCGDTIQFVCELKCLDDTYEEFSSYDVITLQIDQQRQYWVIREVSKIMIGEENGSHAFFPIFGNDLILVTTIRFVNEYDFESGSGSAGEFELSPDFALEVCQEVKSDWNKLPEEVQQFYLHAVEERYNRDGKNFLVDLFSIEMN